MHTRRILPCIMFPEEGAAGRLGGYILKKAGEIEGALNKKRQELCPWNHIGAEYEEALAENRVSSHPSPRARRSPADCSSIS